MEYKENKLQPIVGIGLLLLLLIFSVILGKTSPKLPLFLITGVALGYILTRSRYGFAGGIKRIYITGEGSLSKALIIMFALSMLLAAIIHWNAASAGALPSFRANGSSVIPGTSSVHFANIGTVLGGFLFGIGMMIAGGCASGTLSDLGEGAMRAAIGLVFFILGSIPGLGARYLIDKSSLGKIGFQVYLPDYVGYIGAIVISFALLFALYLLTVKYEKFRKKEGFYQETVYEEVEKPVANNIYHKLFVQRWSFLTGGILLSIVFAFIIVSTKHSWGVTGPFTNWGIAFLQMFGLKFSSPAFTAAVKTVNSGLLKDPGTLRNVGIILGAAIAFLLAGRFKFDFDFKAKDVAYYVLGGLLMGFGARLSGGCNIGALYSGICNFSLAGWVFFIALSLGGIVGLKLFEGRVNTIPPNRHKRKEA